MVATILLASLLLASVVTADTSQLVEVDSRDNSAQCDCYVVSGPSPGYFQYHRFWDFRNITTDIAGSGFTTPPPLITAAENQGGQNTTSPYFNTTAFLADWSIQNNVERPDAAVPSVNSAQNVFISSGLDGVDSTYLALRTSRLEQFASVAEIDSNQKNMLHSSIRTRMRVIPTFFNASSPFVNNGISLASISGLNDSHPTAPGAVLGFFTYQSDTEESDIEILTLDPTTHIRYSNQPDYDAKTGNTVPGASTDTVLPKNKVWTEWHDHRIDWYDGMSRWYVDDELVLEKTLNVPSKPSGLILNLWSDGGEWSGNMTVGSQIIAGFQWIEMAFNISGKNSQKRHESSSCHIGCNVDQIKEVGFPELAFNTTGNAASGRLSVVGDRTAGCLVLLFWTALIVSGVSAF